MQENITKRMKTIIKQGPIKINQTGISIVLQKQLHRIAFRMVIFSYFFQFLLLIQIENHIPDPSPA